MKNYKKLNVWILAMKVAEDVLVISNEFPKAERFEITSQINRSAVSIPSNIAEGSGRGTDAELARFLRISLGSCYELETQLLLVKRLRENKEIDTLLEELTKLQKMISKFINTLKS